MKETSAQRYNKRLHRIFDTEIQRLKKVEDIAKEIIDAIDTHRTMYPNANNCHLINKVQRILSEKTNLKPTN